MTAASVLLARGSPVGRLISRVAVTSSPGAVGLAHELELLLHARRLVGADDDRPLDLHAVVHAMARIVVLAALHALGDLEVVGGGAALHGDVRFLSTTAPLGLTSS
jgi:hypothetical protein